MLAYYFSRPKLSRDLGFYGLTAERNSFTVEAITFKPSHKNQILFLSLSRKLNSSLSITPHASGKHFDPPSCGGDSESASKKYIDRFFVIWASGLCFGSVLGIFQFSILFISLESVYSFVWGP